MSLKKSLKSSLKDNYFSFTGRAPRAEYWYLQLVFIFVNVAFSSIIFAFGISGASPNKIGGALFILMAMASLYFIMPTISVSVRRLHDLNRSGWWLLVVAVAGAIPFVGIAVCIGWVVAMCLKGTSGKSRFGGDPLADSST